MTRLEVGLAIAVAALIALGLFDLYARHAGAQQCVQADSAAATKQEVHTAKVEAAGTVAAAAEDARRAAQIAAPVAPAPTVSLQPAAAAPRACPVLKAGPAAAAREPTADVRAADPPSLVLEDADSFIAADVQRARDADIEIADRNELLRQRDAVCRGQAPSF